MTAENPSAAERMFWELATPLLALPGVSRSTMMGFPCLRLNGDFFASIDKATGCLIVKLDKQHVEEHLAAARAEPFAPNGRAFREWAAVPYRRRRSWARHLDDALALAASRTGSRR